MIGIYKKIEKKKNEYRDQMYSVLENQRRGCEHLKKTDPDDSDGLYNMVWNDMYFLTKREGRKGEYLERAQRGQCFMIERQIFSRRGATKLN